MIGCRASDVEKKTLCGRKRGKDGPVADSAACSATSVLYGMRIRARGETEQENVDKLLNTLPTLTHAVDSIDNHFDRGYGKLSNIKKNASKGYGGFTMSAEVGSGNPFTTQDKVDVQMKKWRDKGKSESWIEH